MSTQPPVLVVGDLNVDVVVVHPEPLHPGSDSPASISLAGGGSAANSACWLAELLHGGADGGAPPGVRLAAARGDDALGAAAAQELAAAGVELVGPVVPGAGTGACVVLVDATGERTMLPDRGANDRLTPGDVDRALAVPPRWLHLSGYALLHPGSRPAARRALAEARRLGVPTSVDAASAVPIVECGPATVLGWLDGVDVVLANDDELAALGGAEAVLAVAGELVAKHGPDGASWTDGTDRASVAAVPVAVVDTTGAGDAFGAGWIVGRLAGADPTAALAAGAAVAARTVAVVGARPGGAPGHRSP